jgi:RecJ-like exonuclease
LSKSAQYGETTMSNVVSLRKPVTVKAHVRKPRASAKPSTYACDRCGGKGHIDHWAHVANGVCFACGGSGKLASRPVAAWVEPNPEVVVPEDKRSTDKQWAFLQKLCKTDDQTCKVLKKVGAKIASQRYVDRKVMSEAIKLALG